MCATTIRGKQRSTTTGTPVTLMIELNLREAGRLAEWAGVTDPELARLANIAFRLASRVRTDRLAVGS